MQAWTLISSNIYLTLWDTSSNSIVSTNDKKWKQILLAFVPQALQTTVKFTNIYFTKVTTSEIRKSGLD